MNGNPLAISAKTLRLTTTIWFLLAFAGQMIFAYYILMLYAGSTIQGQFERWNSATPHAYQPGDGPGNIVFGLHVALAAVITIGGPLQLIPELRRRVPLFHRISGRIYIGCAFLISIAGLYLNLFKGSFGGLGGKIFISANALIIMACAVFAIRKARTKALEQHRQWAIRLFLAMSGVWFFRVFLMCWLAVNGGPVGFDPVSFSGPFLTLLAFLVYVFPQFIAGYYFRAQAGDSAATKWTFSLLLALITSTMLVGIIAATLGLWLPRL